MFLRSRWVSEVSTTDVDGRSAVRLPSVSVPRESSVAAGTVEAVRDSSRRGRDRPSSRPSVSAKVARSRFSSEIFAPERRAFVKSTS
jgi:hypothetical protein